MVAFGRSGKLAVTFAAAAITLVLLFSSLAIAPLSPSSSALVPVACCTIMLLSLFFAARSDWHSEKDTRTKTVALRDLMPLATITVSSFVYIFSLEHVGFLLSTIVFLLITIKALAGLRLLSAVLLSASIAITFFVLFKHLFAVPLPEGPLNWQIMRLLFERYS